MSCLAELSMKKLYYIFEAMLILFFSIYLYLYCITPSRGLGAGNFLLIFEDDKSDNFLRGDKSFRRLKRTELSQKQSK